METITIDALVLEEAQVIEVLEAARLQLELCEEPMPSGQLEPRQPHGSLERRPGTLVRAMGDFALSKGLFPSKESLARKCVWQLHLAHFGSLIWPTPGLPF